MLRFPLPRPGRSGPIPGSVPRLLALWLLALALLAGPGPARAQPGDWPGELVIGLIRVRDAQAISAAWAPLLADLSAALGLPVRSQVFDDYAGVVWALAEGKAHLAQLGNKSAMEAVDRAGAQVAFKILGPDGEDGYHSVVVVRKQSPLHSVDEFLAQAKNLTYGWGDPNSTSGRLVPGYYLFHARGLNPGALFARVLSQSHEDNALAVAAGRADAASVNNITLRRLAASHPAQFAALRVIWTSPAIPANPLVWRRDLPAELKLRLRAFLPGYGRPAPGKDPGRLKREQEALRGLQWGGVALSDDRQLRPVRELELFTQRLRLESDASLSAEERSRRLGEVDARLRALGRPDWGEAQ